MHRLHSCHVLVTSELVRGVVPWIQPASQDYIAVGDANSSVCIVRLSFESRWAIFSTENACHSNTGAAQGRLAGTADSHRIRWSLTSWLSYSRIGTCILSYGCSSTSAIRSHLRWRRCSLINRNRLESIKSSVGWHGEISLALVPPLTILDHLA